MKTLLSFLISSVVAVSVCAQTINSTVTVQVNGNRERQIIIDDVTYNAGTAANVITIPAVQPGQHTLQVKTLNTTNNRWNNSTNTSFTVREGYDMVVTIAANGSLQYREKRITTRSTDAVSSRTPISSTAFTNLYNSIRQIRSSRSRLMQLTNTFNNSSTYFTSSQVSQLLQLINGESARLQLAKDAYSLITDPSQYTIVSNLLRSKAARDELSGYITTYNNTYNNTTAYNNSGNYNAYASPMSDYNFNTLYQSIYNQYYASSRMSALRDAFANTNNYFTSYQARQLVQLAPDEASRLELAKVSYRRITDVNNFGIMYDILQSQTSKDELARYIQYYGGTANNANTYRTPMSDASFNSIYNNARGQWFPGTKYTVIKDALSTTTNYFTSAQAYQLIALLSDENNRLELAKLVYRKLTDPANVSTLYNLFTTQAYKDDLAAYINNNSSGSYGGSYNNTYRTPMTDASFTSLYNNVRGQWFPGAKYTAIKDAVSTTTNYFTSSQAFQLISLLSDENNRLELAKLVYRQLTDPANVSTLYNLFSTQAYRDDFAAYIRQNQY